MRTVLATPFLAAALLLASPSTKFTTEAWEANQDIYRAILHHPFLTGLKDGSLPRQTFVFYLVQDALYLKEFARALEAASDKAPKAEWAELLRRHARETIEEEKRLQQRLLEDFGLSEDDQASREAEPEAFAYMSYIVAVTHSRPFEEAVAVLLPCYWIYWEVGKELARGSSPDASYAAWIDAYASPSYGEAVESVLAIADEVAGRATRDERARMKEHFRRSSRYEWMFWDSAYRQRGWPPAVKP